MTPEESAALHRRYFLAILSDGITPEYALQLTSAYIHATEMAAVMQERDEPMPPPLYTKLHVVKPTPIKSE